MQNNKSKSTGLIIAAIAVVILGIGGATYALMQATPAATDKPAATKTPEPLTGPAQPDYKAPDPLLPTIVFNDKGFTQASYTFPAGTAIKVDNQSSNDVQFSSADHPAHRDTPELNMPVIGAGKSGTFTPPGSGTYGFHDHLNAQFEGTLVIQ